MVLELYQQVALRRDVPEYRLKAGDVATLVDFVPHPGGGEDGCVLEVFNVLGDSIAVLAVPLSAVAPLHEGEVFSVRVLNVEGGEAA